MTWVIWRSHRTALLSAATVVVAVALVMATLVGTGSLGVALGVDGSARRELASAVIGLSILAPALAGAFLGAPLLARDLERGTHVLLLTQTASRRRWATTSLLLVGGIAVAAVAATTLVLQPLNSSAVWYSLENFSATGALPFARTLSAFTLGALIGLLLQRVLAASALTLAAVIVTEVALVSLRNVLVAPVLRTATLPYGSDVDSHRDQLIDYGYADAGTPSPIGPGCAQDDLACLQGTGINGNWALVRPLELRWPMHWVEVGLHAALSAVALTLLFMRLRRPLGR